MRAAIDILIGNICHIRVTSVSFIEETWYLDIGMTSVKTLYTLNITSTLNFKLLRTMWSGVILFTNVAYVVRFKQSVEKKNP